MLRIAQIGLGYWGPNLLRNFATLENVSVKYICDLDAPRAAKVARRVCPAAEVISDISIVNDDPDVDAVVIATPIHTHYRLAMAALSSGKHVFVEKPLAATTRECQDLVDQAALKQRILMVGHVFEYNSAVHRIREYIDSGELGSLFYVYSQRVNLGRIQRDISAMWSFAPHDLSIMNFWLGQEPLRVSARGFSFLNHGIDDVVFMILDYPDNVRAHLHLGWLDPRKVRQMTLVGSKQMLVYDDVSNDAKIQVYDKFQFQIRQGNVTIPRVSFDEPLQTECQHFVDCIVKGQTPRTDGWNGLRVVKILEAAEQSLAADGKPIDLENLGKSTDVASEQEAHAS
jgi:predicted dehydrogenase